MKINRPEGISQANRSNPYFILLRKASDEQIELANSAAQQYVKNTLSLLIVTIISIILPIILVVVKGDTVYISASFAIFLINLLNIYRSRELSKVLNEALKQCTFKDVDSMIFTNEYQVAAINQEYIFNLFTLTCKVNGILTNIYEVLHKEFTLIILFGVLEILSYVIFACSSM